ncbi:MAG: hypothetical protein NVSMB31_17050 [Vulcanimicrobiaceae bacterium]
MTQQDPNREQVFVVRFWPDPNGTPADAWRGCVAHVPSGQRQFFVTLSVLTEFMNACLHEASHAKTPQKL